MAGTRSPRELLAGAVPLWDADEEDLVEWIEAVEDAPGKLHARVEFGLQTSGYTLSEFTDHIGEDAGVAPGDYQEGWVAMPALGECPNSEETQPQVAIGNPDEDVLLVDCLGCGVRWSLDALDDDASLPEVEK